MARVVIAAVLLLAAPVSIGAQSSNQPDANAAPTFRAKAEIVALAVTVVGQDNEHIAGLGASDFVVLEDGVEQPIAYFAATAAPVDLTLLVDASASMGDKMKAVRAAARGLTRSLRPQDRAAVIEFRDSTQLVQTMTADHSAIEAGLERIRTSGNTAMYTALYVALSGMESPQGDGMRRRAVVVLSDGDDTASLVGYEDVLEKAQRNGVAVYAVALTLPTARTIVRTIRTAPELEGERTLWLLARDTGGTAFFPAAVEDLSAVYGKVAQELGRQYMIGYTPVVPSSEKGAWRRLTVRLPAHPRAKIRTRTGYYAGEGPAFAAPRLGSSRP